MANESSILILGGAGKTGRRVAERLAARGAAYHLASRSSARAFDWEQPETWAPALRGASALYLTYHPDLAMPGAAERVRELSDLAARSGVRQIVLLSGRGEHHVWPSERAVREAGVSFTILRCAWFMQNFSEGHLLGPLLDGELAFPAGATREPFIDCDDIADVAVAALTAPAAHAGQIYDLTGPALLSFADAVAEIGRVAGRALRYTPISLAAYAELLAPHLPAEQVTFFHDLFGMLLDGHNALLTDGVERALGRPPRDFQTFAQRAAQAGAWRV